MDNLISDAGDFIDRRVRQTVFSLKESGIANGKLGGRAFGSTSNGRSTMPKNDLPPERQQKLLHDLRVLADRARLFIFEAGRAFSPAPARTEVQDK